MNGLLTKDALLEQTLHLLIMAHRKETHRIADGAPREGWYDLTSDLLNDLLARWHCPTCEGVGYVRQPIYTRQFGTVPAAYVPAPCLDCKTSGIAFQQIAEGMP